MSSLNTRPHPHPHSHSRPQSQSQSQSRSPPAQAQPHPSSSSSTTQLPRPDFRPLFTLITDITTTSHHHPTVHYIFSDDDDGPITDAALQLHHLAQSECCSENSGAEHDENASGGDEHAQSGGRSQQGKQRRHERHVIVSLSADGQGVRNVQSMAGDWQVLSAEVGAAPTWDDGVAWDGGEEEGKGKGLMLRIEGTRGTDADVDVGEDGVVDMEGLMEGFGKRMEELRRVVEKGGGGK